MLLIDRPRTARTSSWSTRPVAVIVASSLLLAACAVQRPQERVVASDLELNTTHLTEGTTRSRVIFLQGSEIREIGVVTTTIRFMEHEGSPAVLLVRSFPTPSGEILDSALALRHTLAPVWQHSHQPTKTMLLAFSDSGVTGEWAPTDSAMRTLHHPTPRPVYDATDQEMLIASLPLADGYRALIPIYTFELGGMELDTLHVIGTERMTVPGGALRDAWKVGFGDPFITATFWVDRETRRILREDVVSRRTGATFRQIPLS
jgi:hypothetical protein